MSLSSGEAVEDTAEDELVGDGAMQLVPHVEHALRAFAVLLLGDRVDDRIEHTPGDDVQDDGYVEILGRSPEGIVGRVLVGRAPLRRDGVDQRTAQALAAPALELGDRQIDVVHRHRGDPDQPVRRGGAEIP